MPTESVGMPTNSVFEMILASGPIVQGVLYLLILLSIWSWAISISKFLQFKRAQRDSDEFRHIFWETKNFARVEDSARRLTESPLTQIFVVGYQELIKSVENAKAHSDPENELKIIERALKRAEFEEAIKLEKGSTFLATVASSAPFIGLFGTVWGIMTAFHNLGLAKSTTIQAVAPGISEALVATAVGLAAAIPAAVAYNYFAALSKNFKTSMSNFSAEFLGLARKNFVR